MYSFCFVYFDIGFLKKAMYLLTPAHELQFLYLLKKEKRQIIELGLNQTLANVLRYND